MRDAIRQHTGIDRFQMAEHRARSEIATSCSYGRNDCIVFGKAGIVGFRLAGHAWLPPNDGAADRVQRLEEIQEQLVARCPCDGVVQIVVPSFVGAPVLCATASIGAELHLPAVGPAGIERSQSAQFRFDGKADRHDLFGQDLIAQIGDVLKIEHWPRPDKGSPPHMTPDAPLRFELRQCPAQLIAPGSQLFAQVAFRRDPVVVPVSGIVDQVAQSLREVGHLGHGSTQFDDWLID